MLTAINVLDVSPASDDFTALATRLLEHCYGQLRRAGAATESPDLLRPHHLGESQAAGVADCHHPCLCHRRICTGRASILQCAPGDAAAFADLARRLIDDHAALGAAARGCVVVERAVRDRRHWADHLDAFIEKKNLC